MMIAVSPKNAEKKLDILIVETLDMFIDHGY
jgi:hypothetical protein